MAHRLSTFVAAAAALVAVSPAAAGPPFVTDDPVPTDPGHWEIYTFAAGARADGVTGGQAGFDLNYGGAKDLQLTAVLPVGFDAGQRARLGLSNIELAAKYRFLHQAEATATPDAAFFPRVIVATGGSRFSTGHTALLLPVWLSKEYGAWSLFGGGGYEVNPGGGQRSFWISGFGATRALSERLSVGAELYHHSRDADEGRSLTGINFGALYRFTPHWSLIGSMGPGVQNASREGSYDFYAALKADY